MKIRSWVVLFLVISLVGCEVPKTSQDLSIDQTTTSQISTPVPPPPPVAAQVSNFSSNGDLIADWYWLRGKSEQKYAEWVLDNVPTGQDSVELALTALATNTFNGGKGFEAAFKLYYGNVADKADLSKLRFVEVVLPNVSTLDDPVGYTCLGTAVLDLSGLDFGSRLYLKAMRMDVNGNHLAFNATTIVTVGGSSGDQNSEGQSGEGNQGENGQTEQILNPDDDNDLVPNNNETFYGTQSNNPDTDGDGIIDGKDLSSMINPSEPTWNDLQKKGMVRIEQPALAYGLDGWVDVYERYFSAWPPRTWMKKIAYKEDDGTKKSTMDEDHYKKSLNKIFNDQKFTCYQVENKTAADFASGTAEKVHDLDAETSLIYSESLFVPKRYEFYYDYLSDYQLAYLKNTEEIKYPSESEYFKYLLYPLNIYTGKEQTIALQFKDNQMYADLYDNNDNDYKLPAFLYTFYNNNNFDADDGSNVAYYKDNLAMASLIDGNNLEVRITLPADLATNSSSYLKITPVWVIKKNGKTDYKPMNLNWDLTGIVRDVVISKAENNNTTLSLEYKNFEGLNNTPVDAGWVKTHSGSADYQSRTETMKMLTKDPNAPVNERYNDLEVGITATNYVEKEMGIAGNVYSVIEAVTVKSNKVKEITDLPADHWARQSNYTGPIAIFAVAQGVASVATNGQQAWTAYKNGEKMNVAYYSAKAVLGGTNAVANVVKVTENTIGYAGKAGRLAKLTTKKAGVILAVATGTVEASYNIYKYNSTNDPILKSSYAENVGANVLDTGISVAAVFSPHVLAVQATWMIEIEIYGLIFGEDFAYQVAKSPGQAAMFLSEYFFTGDVPSQMSKTAYTDCRDDLLEWIENDNAVQLPYMAFFVDPDVS
ncbi:MAG: hypothetical protein ACOZAR_03890 [Patescibacteria group bacterium]